MTNVTLTHIGGPTAQFTLGGWTFLTDPTFDPPGEFPGAAGTLVKTRGPAVELDELPDTDVILLSHDQHADNLDRSGRMLVESLRARTFSTVEAGQNGSTVHGMKAWDEVTLQEDGKETLTLTAVPALHGPEGAEKVAGTVTGFVLAGVDQPTVYFSGDNASVDRVREIAMRFPKVDVAILCAGAARVGALDNAALTLTAEDALKVVRILGRPTVVPVHAEGWAHFSEGYAELRAAFEGTDVEDRLTVPEPGRALTLA